MAFRTPNFVVVPAGQSSLDVPCPTFVVTSPVGNTISARTGGRQAVLAPRISVGGKIGVASLRVTKATFDAGNSIAAELNITSPAPTGGFKVKLFSGSPKVSVPAEVIVPAGSSGTTFTISSTASSLNETATISATANGSTQKLDVQARSLTPYLIAVTLDSPQVYSGSGVPGFLYLSREWNGSSITARTDTPVVSVPSTLTPYGGNLIPFQLSSTPVSADTPGNVFMSWNGRTVSAAFVAVAMQRPSVARILFPEGLTSMKNTYGRVELSSPAGPKGEVISFSGINNLVNVPPKAFVPPGATSVDFPVTVRYTGIVRTGDITAILFKVRHAVKVSVQPSIGLKGITFSSNPVKGGLPFQMTISLNMPAGPGGEVVELGTSATTMVMPPEVTVPEGQMQYTFTVPTKPVTSTVTRGIVAWCNGSYWEVGQTLVP